MTLDPRRVQIEQALYTYGRWVVLRLDSRDYESLSTDYDEDIDSPTNRRPYRWYNYPDGIWVKLRYEARGNSNDQLLGTVGRGSPGTYQAMVPLIVPANVIVNQFTSAPITPSWNSGLVYAMGSAESGIPIKENDIIIIPDYWGTYPPGNLSLDGLNLHETLVVTEAHLEHLSGPALWLLEVKAEVSR
jgi:hypothetical protein